MKISMIGWLIRRLPDCDATTRMISASMDQGISLRQRIQVQLHLMICRWCARYNNQILLLRKLVRQRSNHVVRGESLQDSSLTEEARERIKRRLLQE